MWSPKRIAIAQSGGPTSAINASLVGIYRAAKEWQGIAAQSNITQNAATSDAACEPIVVYGVKHGVQGLLAEQFLDLDTYLTDSEQIALLRKTPATALGSCRYRLPNTEKDAEPYRKIQGVLERNQIDALFYIGGNDSMDTVAKLSAWLETQDSPIRVIGVPKTIDNDLVETDHTPGFGSAVKYLATTMSEIIEDSSVYYVPSVTICEIMGRDAGWLTASTCVLQHNGMAAPHLIYLPEGEMTVSKFLADVRDVLKTHQSVICAVSEGVRLPDAGEYRSGANDAFGHAYLSGVGKYLEEQVRAQIGCKVRAVELNVMQRCSAHLAAETDLAEAEACGAHAFRLAAEGKTGRMAAMQRKPGETYEIVYTDVAAADVANQIRLVPKAWITPEGNGIVDEAVSYFLPLMQGDVPPTMRNGMPVHFRFAE